MAANKNGPAAVVRGEAGDIAERRSAPDSSKISQNQDHDLTAHDQAMADFAAALQTRPAIALVDLALILGECSGQITALTPRTRRAVAGRLLSALDVAIDDLRRATPEPSPSAVKLLEDMPAAGSA